MRLRQAIKIVVKHTRQTGEYPPGTLFKACRIVFNRCRDLVPQVIYIMTHMDNMLLDIHMNSLNDTHPVKLEWIRRTGLSVQGVISGRPSGKYPVVHNLDT